LAAWYAQHGGVRDHKEMFVITLGRSTFEGHRDVGLALLRQLPPYEVARVVDYIKGHQVTRRVPKGGAEVPAHKGRRGKGRRVELETKVEQVGLKSNVPRSMRTEIERYLREREMHPERLDSAILHGRAALKRLYAGLHIKPSARAQAILFTDEPP